MAVSHGQQELTRNINISRNAFHGENQGDKPFHRRKEMKKLRENYKFHREQD
jgi:hypothetical protein